MENNDLITKVIDLHEKLAELRGMLVVLTQTVTNIKTTFDEDKKRIEGMEERLKQLEDYRKRANTILHAIFTLFSKWQTWAVIFFVSCSIDKEHLIAYLKTVLPA